jgi:quercetin dioxygenase-like cupin family protein
VGRQAGPPAATRRIETARASEILWRRRMYVFNLKMEQAFDPRKHVEKVLGRVAGGDMTVACWEPGQCSPNHLHPTATEIYFCFEGGGIMRTPDRTVDVVPGSFVVHPPGELHEYENGPQRSLLFRVRYGESMSYRTKEWRGQQDWQPNPDDAAYFRQHPFGETVEVAAIDGQRDQD